jgi:CheY-like chemotaxis protein/REP element-mobilizing transposase RayT
MTIKVLIVDPDIAFTVPVKRALEQSGDYAVHCFASGQAAVEMLQREPHDVAILDFNIDDMDVPGLIQALRGIQPGLFILASPRTTAQIELLPSLDVQGSITKPYFARQLGPVIREAALARNRLAKSLPKPANVPAEPERQVGALPAREEPAVQPDAPETADTRPTMTLSAPTAPVAPMAPGVPQAAPLTSPESPQTHSRLVTESPVGPDDTFRRLIHKLQGDDTEKSRSVDALNKVIKSLQAEGEEPPADDDSTIREVVSGQADTAHGTPASATASDDVAPDPATVPETLPEMAEPSEDTDQMAALETGMPHTPDLAMVALETVEDETVPLDHMTPEKFVEEVRQKTGAMPPIPEWVRENAEDDVKPLVRAIVEPPIAEDDTQISPDEAGRLHEAIAEPAEPAPPDHFPEQVPPIRIEGEEPTEKGARAVQPAQSSAPAIEEPVPGNESADRIRPIEVAAQVPIETGSTPILSAPVIPPPPEPGAGLPFEAAPQLQTAPPTAFAVTHSHPEALETTRVPEPEVDPITRLAVQLTQLTLESTAQATLLSQGERLLTSAGPLQLEVLTEVAATINQIWQSAEGEGTTLIRYIQIAEQGDFLLYSTQTLEAMRLSMLFAADTPVKVIRRQAKQLLHALENVPESPTPEGAVTLVSRPTDLRPPTGLHEAPTYGAASALAAAEPTHEPEDTVPRVEPKPEVPHASYAFVWLPRAGQLAPEVGEMLPSWLNDIAGQHDWRIEGTEVQPNYVTLQVSIPTHETPTETVEVLMRETSTHAMQSMIWADAYYIVSPGRAVTQQEIADFISYQREADEVA